MWGKARQNQRLFGDNVFSDGSIAAPWSTQVLVERLIRIKIWYRVDLRHSLAE
jgi:hypothetical protein